MCTLYYSVKTLWKNNVIKICVSDQKVKCSAQTNNIKQLQNITEEELTKQWPLTNQQKQENKILPDQHQQKWSSWCLRGRGHQGRGFCSPRWCAASRTADGATVATCTEPTRTQTRTPWPAVGGCPERAGGSQIKESYITRRGSGLRERLKTVNKLEKHITFYLL